MATQRGSGNPLQRLYSDRIGTPNTDDEVMGYWIFALGALIGILGFALFVPSESATGLRELAIAVGAIGLPLMLAGPVIRLPLERSATLLVAAGIATCFVAVAWFVTIFPSGWDLSTGHQNVMGLYALGLAAITAGGVFVPMLSSVRRGPEEESERNAALKEQRDDALADEADLARELETMRRTHATHDADMADAMQDEEDMAAVLRKQGASKARFEVYQDVGGEWRWRLRHHNGNIIADCGEGYTRKASAVKGMRSVRKNALGANTFLHDDDEEPPEPGDGFEPTAEVDGEETFAPFDEDLDDTADDTTVS